MCGPRADFAALLRRLASRQLVEPAYLLPVGKQCTD
jgi:hypothetical protein